MTAEGTIHIAQVGFQVTLDNGHRDACTDDERHTSIEGGENIFAVRSFGSGMDAVESYFDRAGDKALYGNSKPVPSWQYFATITYKYAEIAIAQSPKNGDVGGEIDQVHLNVSGIHWLHQKAACRTSPE
jgi:hypothetical protein